MKNDPHGPQESDFPPGIGRPARQALNEAGYYRLEQLTEISEGDLKKLHGMGPKAIGVLRDALSTRGLSFAEVTKEKAEI